MTCKWSGRVFYNLAQLLHIYNRLEPTITPTQVLIMESAMNLLVVSKFILLLNYINESSNEKWCKLQLSNGMHNNLCHGQIKGNIERYSHLTYIKSSL